MALSPSTAPNTTLTTVVYRNAVYFFAAILLCAIWGFWPTYYSNPLQVSDYYVHAHGVMLTLWCITLVAQGYLVRSGRRDIHRQVGKTAFILAPMVFLSTLAVIHNGVDASNERGVFLLAVTLNNVLLFGITAGLGFYHRREPAVHARYMLCTVLPMFAPIFGRIIRQLGAEIEFIPQVGGRPALQIVSYVGSDGILLALAIWDWVSHRRLRVFPVLFAVYAITHLALFAVYDQPFWAAFAQWFKSLPLT